MFIREAEPELPWMHNSLVSSDLFFFECLPTDPSIYKQSCYTCPVLRIFLRFQGCSLYPVGRTGHHYTLSNLFFFPKLKTEKEQISRNPKALTWAKEQSPSQMQEGTTGDTNKQQQNQCLEKNRSASRPKTGHCSAQRANCFRYIQFPGKIQRIHMAFHVRVGQAMMDLTTAREGHVGKEKPFLPGAFKVGSRSPGESETCCSGLETQTSQTPRRD